jgi:hypothetical protein
MHPDTQQVEMSRTRLWSARVMCSLAVLFLLFDSTLHLAKPPPVVEAFAKLGYPLSASVGIGLAELLCLAAYIIPQTAVLGGVLLTGLLGGAIATQVRAGNPAFEAYVFPTLLGVLLWGGVWLRDRRLRALFPVRSRD